MNVSNDDVPLGRNERSFIYAVARKILRDDDAASDVTQDAMLLAYRHRDQFRGASAHRTWLYRIAVTTALGYLRKQRRSREELAVDGAVAWEPADPGPSPEDECAARELASRVDEALDAIAPPHRDVFLLRAEDRSEAEIAAECGITVANVKIRAHRARQQLRQALAVHHVRAPRALSASRARRDTRADRTATSRAS